MREESLCFRVYTHSQTQGNVVYLIYLRLKIGVLPPAGDSAGPRVPLLGGSGALKGSGDPPGATTTGRTDNRNDLHFITS